MMARTGGPGRNPIPGLLGKRVGGKRGVRGGFCKAAGKKNHAPALQRGHTRKNHTSASSQTNVRKRNDSAAVRAERGN